MMPALFMRMSRRSDWEVKVLTAFWMEAKDVRSSSRKVMEALGTAVLICEMEASAADLLRAARKMCAGSW